MRRAAAMSHNSEIIQILSAAADEAEADATEMEMELRRQIQNLPPQS
jgi:hypothetical protein